MLLYYLKPEEKKKQTPNKQKQNTQVKTEELIHEN